MIMDSKFQELPTTSEEVWKLISLQESNVYLVSVAFEYWLTRVYLIWRSKNKARVAEINSRGLYRNTDKSDLGACVDFEETLHLLDE